MTGAQEVHDRGTKRCTRGEREVHLWALKGTQAQNGHDRGTRGERYGVHMIWYFSKHPENSISNTYINLFARVAPSYDHHLSVLLLCKHEQYTATQVYIAYDMAFQ